MQAIENNESTQQLIAGKYNEGVVPMLRDEDPDNAWGSPSTILSTTTHPMRS